MSKLIIFLMLIATSSVSLASTPQWMKTKDIDSLGLYVFVKESCPFSKAEVREKIEGEYLRARIKPTDSIDLFIEVDVSCLDAQIADRSVGYVVSYETSFGTYFLDTIMMYRFPQYGSLAVGNGDASSLDFFVNSIAESVEDALTDYLKVNLQE